MQHKRILGIDVSKLWLDAALAGETAVTRIGNDKAAIARLLARLKPDLVAFEPTGGYERLLERVLREKGIGAVRLHPNDVVAYRKSRGIKAKTDRIDARLIAAFAADELVRRGPRPRLEGDPVLRELAARRRQLLHTIHAEDCRLAMAEQKSVRRSIGLVVAALGRSLKTLEAEIARHLQSNPKASRDAALLQSLIGIGPVVAMTLIADLPELGQLSGKKIAALAGLAPVTRRSGKTRYPERIGFGRPAVRQAMFNAARAAIRHPSPFRTFYDRLVEQNKRPGKVALAAVMRKLLVTANAILRDQTPWRLAETT
jgi:transposase